MIPAWAKKELEWVTPTAVDTSGSYSLGRTCDNVDIILISHNFFPSGENLQD